MTTVVIEIDDVTAKFLREKAEDRGVTLGQYVAKLARWDVADEAPRAPLPEGLPPGVDASGRTPEQVAADRERILATVKPGRPLPPGMTWVDMLNELGGIDAMSDHDDPPSPNGHPAPTEAAAAPAHKAARRRRK